MWFFVLVVIGVLVFVIYKGHQLSKDTQKRVDEKEKAWTTLKRK